MRILVAALVLLVSTARADDHLPPIIAIASVTASAEVHDSVYSTWAVIAPTGMGQWCVVTPERGVGESLTIAFDPPAKLAAITAHNVGGDTNQVSALDVIADGHTQRAVVRDGALEAKLDADKPITKLVLKIATVAKGGAPATCLRSVELSPSSGIVYGVTAAEAAALEARVLAMRDALRTCKGLGDVLAFPFAYSEMTMDNTGMKEKLATYKTAATATAACKKKKLAAIVKATSFDSASVEPKDRGKLVVRLGKSWYMRLERGAWRLETVADM